MENLGNILEDLGEVRVSGKKPSLTYVGRLTKNLEPDGDGDKSYVFFVGIPYAMPPVGRRRFLPPQPYESKLEIYEALKSKPVSPQYDETNNVPIGSEDCLYLNIYLPKRPKKGQVLWPVLVFFHGGGFCRGNANYENVTPDSIMKENIVFVTVNYRLGVFGFLNMHWKYCKGNAGLKDQVMSLRWIKDNIKAFGGDPGNVTICGQSAGGSCVNFHLISPLSKGLFHKAIVMSGGIFSPWGYTGHHRELMLNYKEYVDHKHASREIVVNTMKRAQASNLLQLDRTMALNEIYSVHRFPIYLGASVECSSEGAFIPPCDKIEELMNKAEPVPILAGICKREGYMIYASNYYQKDMNWIKDEESFIQFLMVNLRWSRESAVRRAASFKEKYFNKLPKMSDYELKQSMATFCTDLWFYNFYDNFKFKRNWRNKSTPFYVYSFDFVDTINSTLEYVEKPLGAGHGDDVDFLFCPLQVREKYKPFSPSVQSKIKTICSLWASFCKTGKPKSALHNVKWKPHTDAKGCYLYIGNENFKMTNGRLNEQRWNHIREIIRLEEPIRSLRNTPATPGCYEASIEDVFLNASVESAQESSNPTESSTDGKDSNRSDPLSSKPGPSKKT